MSEQAENTQTQLEEPRFEDGEPMLMAGIHRELTFAEMGVIPQLWNEFHPQISALPGVVGTASYGVNSAPLADDSADFGYMVAVQVSDLAIIPADFAQLRIPAYRFAIFPHRGYVTELTRTIGAVMSEWLPKSGYRIPQTGPGSLTFLERYSDQFDPETGRGGMEVWMPISG